MQRQSWQTQVIRGNKYGLTVWKGLSPSWREDMIIGAAKPVPEGACSGNCSYDRDQEAEDTWLDQGWSPSNDPLFIQCARLSLLRVPPSSGAFRPVPWASGSVSISNSSIAQSNRLIISFSPSRWFCQAVSKPHRSICLTRQFSVCLSLSLSFFLSPLTLSLLLSPHFVIS